jgi:TonB family protein
MSSVIARVRNIFVHTFDWEPPFLYGSGNKNAVAIAGVLLLHIMFVWIIVWSLHTAGPISAPRELEILLAQPSAVSKPKLIDIEPPTAPIAAPPDIVIDNDTVNTAPTAASSTIVLPPRPDPTHPNPPLSVANTSPASAVVLKVHVLPTGEIDDAQVVSSSGEAEVDSAAIQFVEGNWRFRPAMLGATPVEYWTTVTVPIASG